MTADLLLTHFNQVFLSLMILGTPFGAEMKKAQVLEDGYIAVKDGKILALGSGEPDASLIGPDTKIQVL